MKIGIIGAGAMGSLLGWYLSNAAEVWLLDPWQTHVDSINTSGLWRELDGVTDVRYPHATSDPAAIGPCDVVLVLVKAQQTGWAGEQARVLVTQGDESRQGDKETGRQGDDEAVGSPTSLSPGPPASRSPGLPVSLSPCLLSSPGLVVTLQNGVGNRELLAEALGVERVGQGVTSLGATLLGPGQVRHAGQGTTVFGSTPDAEGARVLAAVFNAAGLPAEVSNDLDGLVWGKLLVNVGINALTALLRVPNGALAQVREARMLLHQAVCEAAEIAAAQDISLPYDDPVAHALAVAEATAANRSSMLQDVLRGSPTEIATINGAVVREGRRLGVPTPVNELLTALVMALDATAGMRVG